MLVGPNSPWKIVDLGFREELLTKKNNNNKNQWRLEVTTPASVKDASLNPNTSFKTNTVLMLFGNVNLQMNAVDVKYLSGWARNIRATPIYKLNTIPHVHEPQEKAIQNISAEGHVTKPWSISIFHQNTCYLCVGRGLQEPCTSCYIICNSSSRNFMSGTKGEKSEGSMAALKDQIALEPFGHSPCVSEEDHGSLKVGFRNPDCVVLANGGSHANLYSKDLYEALEPVENKQHSIIELRSKTSFNTLDISKLPLSAKTCYSEIPF
jgi:hypothetical protein